jgi:hypothetical protein
LAAGVLAAGAWGERDQQQLHSSLAAPTPCAWPLLPACWCLLLLLLLFLQLLLPLQVCWHCSASWQAASADWPNSQIRLRLLLHLLLLH